MHLFPRIVVGALVVLLTVQLQVGMAKVQVPSISNPQLYVDPDSPARTALAANPASAPTTTVLADTPQAHWFTDATPTAEVARAVAGYVDGAAAVGAVPVLVVYAIPMRDCGGFSAGGFTNASEYGAWIRQVRAGIGGHRAAVIVEPDALVDTGCLDASARAARFTMLKDAVFQLSSDTSTVVYIDGGHSRWLSPTALAHRLQQVGVEHARGFSLNVSNFFTTAEETAYGEEVSALLGGKHYVIDTSRNGRGPAPDGPLNWCNPPGRALGAAPTTHTAGAHDDAYLWIKNPGQSDGECDRGDPVSGRWFAAYAAGLVQRARLMQRAGR